MIKAHCLQHIPFEELGSIRRWLNNRQAKITATKLFENENFPSQETFDWLIVMGGPMGVNEQEKYPWLDAEKQFILDAINSNKPVLGICLGAQLIASCLGAKVYPNKVREIGWFPIKKINEIQPDGLNAGFPDIVEAFHWHGDTFDLPESTRHLYSSEACKNQGFLYGDRVLGLQFHLEITFEDAKKLIKNCPGDLIPGSFVQDEKAILKSPERFNSANAKMEIFLEYFFTLLNKN